MFLARLKDLFPFLRVVWIYGRTGKRDGNYWSVSEVLGGRTS